MEFTVVDSDKAKALYEHRIFAAAYEPYWQQVRFYSKFRPFDVCRATLVRLEAYILLAPRDDPHERALRVWRAYNLANATPIGQVTTFATQRIPRDESKLIISFRRKWRTVLHEEGYPSYWDWAITRKNCEMLHNNDEGAAFLAKLYKSLKANRAYKNEPKVELRYFLSILEELWKQ